MPRLSTAVFDGAQHSTRSPRSTRWRITSTSVRVLPVPGGPHTSAMSPLRRPASTAARWRSSSATSSGVHVVAAIGRGGRGSAAPSPSRARSEFASAALAFAIAASPRSNVSSGASGSSAYSRSSSSTARSSMSHTLCSLPARSWRSNTPRTAFGSSGCSAHSRTGSPGENRRLSRSTVSGTATRTRTRSPNADSSSTIRRLPSAMPSATRSASERPLRSIETFARAASRSAFQAIARLSSHSTAPRTGAKPTSWRNRDIVPAAMAETTGPERLTRKTTSIAQMFAKRVHDTPDREAFRYPVPMREPAGPAPAGGNDSWRSMTWRQAGERVKAIAAGLGALGLKREGRVGILANTRLEWLLTDLGILSAGGATTTVYPSSTAEECAFILADSDTRYVFVEDAKQLDKLRAHKAEMPELEKVILIDGSDKDSQWTLTLAELEAKGAEQLAKDPRTVDELVGGIVGTQLATLIYTSGTTGKPKGVRLL